MKTSILGLVWAAMLVTATLARPSAASAEPRYEIWRCWHLRANTETIPKTQYWSCPLGTILVMDTYSWEILRKISGQCANALWMRSGRKATPYEVAEKCTEWVNTSRP
jgi:hypothetical protein